MSATGGPGPSQAPLPTTGAATPRPPATPAPGARPPDEPPLLETERLAPKPKRRLGRVPLAWIVAIAADVIQWVIWPVFLAGAASPVDDVIDVVVGAVLVKLLGWHWSFAPSFVVKLIPVADFAPTWTMAVFLATRGRART
jgi:hypothetical protein